MELVWASKGCQWQGGGPWPPLHRSQHPDPPDVASGSDKWGNHTFQAHNLLQSTKVVRSSNQKETV